MRELDLRDAGPNMVYPGLMTYGERGGDSLVQIAWRGHWRILVALVLAGGAAYAYLRLATPMYKSTALILVDKPGASANTGLPWQPLGSTSTNYLHTQASMMTSREILAAALQDPNVVDLRMFADPQNLPNLVRMLSAQVGKNSDIISLTASAAQPEPAARLVNAIVRAYIRWHEENRQVNTADLLRDLNSQLEKRTRELQGKRKEQMLFEQRYPEVVENLRGGVAGKTLELLRQELATVRLVVVERDSYYQGLQRFEKTPDAFRQYVYSHRNAALAADQDRERLRLEQELHQAQREAEEMQVPGIIRQSLATMLANRQSTLEQKITALEASFLTEQMALAKTLSEEAHEREKQLADLYEKEFAKVRNLSGQDATYAFLVSECKLIEDQCDSLLNQINNLDLSTRFEGLNIHLLEKAEPAGRPSAPQKARVIGIALALGFLVGFGWVLVRDWRDPRVRSADEIAATLGVPVLGVVPSLAKRRAVAAGHRLPLNGDSHDAEAYRTIRTALFFGVPRERAVTMLITSPARLEGKTTLVINLGIAMAQAGQKTLLLDANLRTPMLHQAFAIPRDSRGLTDVLGGAAAIEEAIYATDVPGLNVLVGGPPVPNPSELLNHPVFTAVLEHLRGKYDRILVDSSPLGEVTDAQVLAAHCSVTLLVLRAGMSTRLLVQRARDALLAVGATLAGVVVNDVRKRDSRYSRPGMCGYSRNDYGYANGGPGLPPGDAARNLRP